MRTLLRNEQWKRIEHMLPGKVADPGGRGEDNRLFVEAVLWISRTGAPWRDLPEHFGRWLACVYALPAGSKSGVWQRVFMELSKHSEFAQRVYLDSTIVRAHQHAAGA
jgi:transposase